MSEVSVALLQGIRSAIAGQFDWEQAKEPPLSLNAREIFDLRYSRKDEDGNPSEDPRQSIIRVALNVAAPNALYGGHSAGTAEVLDRDEVDFPFRMAVRHYNWMVARGKTTASFEELMAGNSLAWLEQAKRYQDLVSSLTFLPNSPTWTGAGTPLGQLAACFVLPLDDDLGRGRGSIFETMKVAALIQQGGGGLGFPFYDLRPKDALVKRSMGKASGPIGFLRVFDAAFGEIAQGGTRRGANMGVMLVSHPDILEFITCKTVEGKIANFNLSVALTDEFMQAVADNGDFQLRWGLTTPSDDMVDYEVSRTVKARELYQAIIDNAWVIGDPGNLFIDRANRDNPLPAWYRLKATNPCGEQWLGPYENCCLGSISVNRFASWDGTYDWDGLREAVALSTQFLDDVVDANNYVDAVPELEEAAEGGRRIGLGPMGIADAMVTMGIRYGSDLGLEFASQLMEFVRYHSMLASIERAKERGAFPRIVQSIYDPELLAELGPGAEYSGTAVKDGTPFTHRLWAPPKPIVEYKTDFGRPELDWETVLAGITAYGIRNCTQLTIAPTGTISNVAGLEGSGCEPLFALVYKRIVMQEGDDIELFYLSELFVEALNRAGIDEATQAEILEAVKRNKGSCQGIELVPEAIRNAFVVAADITPAEHVWSQAVLQAFVDNSISKTINMPKSATPEDVATAYQLAYKLGCKGITIYRQGSRQREVLAVDGGEAAPGKVGWPFVVPLSIPVSAEEDGLPARGVFPMKTPWGKIWVTPTEHPHHPGRPFDIRIQVGKAGNDKHADVEAIGRMASIALRAGVPVGEVVEQLEGIGGETVEGIGLKKIRSAADGIGKLLKRLYMRDAPPPIAEEMKLLTNGNGEKAGATTEYEVDGTVVCEKCHRTTVVFYNGCKYCETKLGGCGHIYKCE